MGAGAKIIAGLEEATRGDFSHVTVEGKTWVRQDRSTQEKMREILSDVLTFINDEIPAGDFNWIATAERIREVLAEHRKAVG